MRGLKGQAAMEYLVTYGWALLALLFVVAILLSTGAFSINSFSTPECTFQPDIPCNSFILFKESVPDGEQTRLMFNITNGLGYPVNITNVTYSSSNLGARGNAPATDEFSPALHLASGESAVFDHAFVGELQPNEREFRTIFVSFTFYNCRNPSDCTGPYVTSGRIGAPVESAG